MQNYQQNASRTAQQQQYSSVRQSSTNNPSRTSSRKQPSPFVPRRNNQRTQNPNATHHARAVTSMGFHSTGGEEMLLKEHSQAMSQGKRSSLGHYPDNSHEKTAPRQGNVQSFPFDRSKINSPRQIIPKSEVRMHQYDSPDIRHSGAKTND